jgi:hypothetical protein
MEVPNFNGTLGSANPLPGSWLVQASWADLLQVRGQKEGPEGSWAVMGLGKKQESGLAEGLSTQQGSSERGWTAALGRS